MSGGSGKKSLAVLVINFFLRESRGPVLICRGRPFLFMEDLIIIILQAIFEFVVESVSYLPLDWWPSRSRTSPESDTVTANCCIWFIIGCGLACVSMLFLKRTWISLPALRIANLVLAPIASAFISQAIARRRSRRNRFIIPRNHFWQSFWFTFGLVSVRFAYAARH